MYKYCLFLTYGDIRYYEFVRKYPGASKEQFVRHKDMIWESYTKGQKDVYDFMIKALWGTYFFSSRYFIKDMGPTTCTPLHHVLILFFQKTQSIIK